MRRNWIKLYVEQSLRGTMMSELSADQRWVWIGLLLMAGDSNIDGIVYLRKTEIGELLGYSDITISELLAVDPDSYISAKEKLIQYEKILVDENNVIKIKNWKKYQSEYSRQKPYRLKSDEKKYNESDSIELDKDKEIDKDKERRKKKSSATNKKKNIEEFKRKIEFFEAKKGGEYRFIGISEEMITGWEKTYYLIEIHTEIEKMIYWLIANPNKRYKNYHRFIIGWFGREQNRRELNSINAKKDFYVGKADPNRNQSKEEIDYRIAREKKLKEIVEKYKSDYEDGGTISKNEMDSINEKIKEEISEWSQEYWEKKGEE